MSYASLKRLLSQRHTLIVIIFIISFGVYFNTLFNDFVYDDEYQVLKNPWIRDVRYFPNIFLSNVRAFQGEGWISNYYRPLMYIVYMLDYHIFGLKPWEFHLTNIIFHAGVSVLVFLISSILINHTTHTPSQRDNWCALIAALLFALHPIHTEAVAWVGGIPELTFTFFYLLAFYLYIKEDGMWGKRYILSILFYFLATLCKETAITMPILLFVYDYSISRDSAHSSRFIPRGIIKRLLPYIIITGIYFILRTYALGEFNPRKGQTTLSNYLYFINIFLLFIKHLEKLVLPIDLNAFHTFLPIQSIFEWKGSISLILTLAFTLSVYLLRHINTMLFFSTLWIVIPLLPVLYIPFLGENPFAERYLYLPSVGFVVLISIMIKGSYRVKVSGQTLIILMLLIAGGLYSIETVKRNSIWRDDYTLWLDTVEKSPEAPQVHNNLGKAYYDKGLIDNAIGHYLMAIKLRADFPEAHNNIGIAYHIKGWIDKSIEHYQIALKIRPNFPEAHSNLGVAYQSKGLIDKAIENYMVALRLRPNNPVAHNNLGKAYYEKGFMDEAIKHLQIAIELRPNFPEAMDNLRKILGDRGVKGQE